MANCETRVLASNTPLRKLTVRRILIPAAVATSCKCVLCNPRSRSDMPVEMSKGLPDYPVPMILLARLAIDASEKGQGLGAALLKDAMFRTVQASEIAGLRALFVHAKDDDAASFYQKYAFTPSPANPLHLFLPLSALKKIIFQ